MSRAARWSSTMRIQAIFVSGEFRSVAAGSGGRYTGIAVACSKLNHCRGARSGWFPPGSRVLRSESQAA